jgi:hypothetical protein
MPEALWGPKGLGTFLWARYPCKPLNPLNLKPEP